MALYTSLVHQTAAAPEERFQTLLRARASTNLADAGAGAVDSPEALLLVAEAAIAAGDRGTAAAAAHRFFQEEPPRNQFYCRALFVRAQLEAAAAGALNGTPALLQTERAVSFVLQALEIAQENRPRYNFLIYNASVLYWRVARTLLRPGASRFAVDSLSAVVDALEAVDDRDAAWRVRLLLSLAHALDDADQSERAAKKLAAAMALSRANGDVFAAELRSLAAHLGRHGGGECKRVLDMARSDGGPEVELQCVRSGLSPPDQLEAILRDIDPYGGDPAAGGDGSGDELGEEELKDRARRIAQYAEQVVDVGRLALQHGRVDLASAALRTAARAKDSSPRTRVKTDLLKAELMTRVDPETSVKLERRRVEAMRLAQQVEAVKLVDRALTACKRLDDPNLVQEACVLVWNLGQPLLQPTLRKHVHRVFEAAASVLEELGAPLLQLRANLHFELAKCEVAVDFLAKAQKQVDKALALDYGLVEAAEDGPPSDDDEEIRPPEGDLAMGASQRDREAELDNNRRRPLDRFLRPLKNKLDLKGSLYKQPDGATEQALLLLEQARESRDLTLRGTLLKRAAAMLDPLEPFEGALGPQRKQQVALWHAICRMGWQLKLVQLAQRAAEVVLSDEWAPDANKEQVIQQVEANFVMAEACVEVLKQTPGARPGGLGVRSDNEDADAIKVRIIACLRAAQDLARSVQQDWLVANALVYLWNFHLHVFRDDRYDEMLPELREALQAMYTGAGDDQETTATTTDETGLCVAHALARALETNDELAEAERICVEAIPRAASPMQAKHLIDTLARIQRSSGARDLRMETDPRSQVLTMLQLLVHPDVEQAEKEDIIGKCMDLLLQEREDDDDERNNNNSNNTTLEQDQANVELQAELWTRLAREALELDMPREAQICAMHATADADSTDTAKVWRWYSLAQCLWAQAIFVLLSSDGQEKDVQDELRVAAMQHLGQAVQFGTRARRPELVLDAAKHFWNLSLPLMTSGVTRRQLFPHLRVMLRELAAAGEQTNLEFRVDLYCLLFECFADAEDWEAGLHAVEEAFQHVPSALQKPLWQFRVIFMSKLGRSVQEGLSKMKENDALLQARAWLTLARSSADPSAQFMSLNRALDAVDGMFERVDYLVDLAEWFLTHNFARDDVQGQLLSALDLLLDVEHRAGDEDGLLAGGAPTEAGAAPDNDDAQSRVSRGSRASRVSRGSRVSRMSRKPRSRRSRAAVTTASTNNRRGSFVSSVSERSTETGTSTSGATAVFAPSSTTPDQLDIEHYELAVRIGVMLSTVANSFDDRMAFARLAANYARRLLEVALTNTARKAARERWAATDQATPFDEYLAAHPPRQPPQSLAAWGSWQLQPLGLSLSKPPLTAHYLDALVSRLAEFGCQLHALPVLALLEAVATEAAVPPNAPLARLCQWRRATALDACGLPRPRRLPKPGLSRDEAQAFAEEVEQREADPTRTRPPAPPAVHNARLGMPSVPRMRISHFEVRRIWTQTAAEVLAHGHVRAAKELLLEAERHCHAFFDDDGLRRIAAVRADIAAVEGDVPRATALATETMHGDVAQWGAAVTRVVDLLLADARVVEARAMLEQALVAFDQLKPVAVNAIAAAAQRDSAQLQGTQQPTAAPDLDAAFGWAACAARLAAVLVDAALQARSTDGDWQPLRDRALDLFAQARATVDGHPLGVELALRHAAALVRVDDALVADAAALLEAAEQDAARLAFDAQPQDEPAGACAPPARLLARVKTQLGRLLLLLHARDDTSSLFARRATVAKLASNPVARWVHATEPTKERTHDEMVASDLDKAHVQLASAHGLVAAAVPKLRPAALANLGTCLQQAAEHQGRLEGVWDAPPAAPLLAPGSPLTEQASVDSVDSSVASEPPAPLLASISPVPEDMSAASSSTAAAAPEGANVDTQAVDMLQEAVRLGRRAEDYDAVQTAAEALLHLHGTAGGAEYVALYQACRARAFLLDTFLKAAKPTNPERLFVEQARRLAEAHVHECGAHRALRRFLRARSTAWRVMACDDDAAALREALPEGDDTAALLLSQSSDGLQLYVAVMGRDAVHDVAAKRPLTEGERTRLRRLLDRMRAFRAASGKFLLRYGDEAGAIGDLTAPKLSASSMLSSVLGGPTAAGGSGSGASTPAGGSSDDDEHDDNEHSADESQPSQQSSMQSSTLLEAPPDELEEQFADMVAELDELLSPLLGAEHVAAALQRRRKFVLCADPALAALPLEALPQLERCTSLARDFSLQVFAHRARGAAEKLAPGDLRFVADPRHEDRGSLIVDNPRTTVTEAAAQLAADLGWAGASGADAVPSVAQLQDALCQRSGGAFLFFGVGRALSYLPPDALAGLNASECQLALLLDRAENDASNRRQSKLDNQKSAVQLALEQPLETAALFTLAGVRSVVLNQWGCSFHSNLRLAREVLPALSQQQRPVAEALQAVLRPPPAAHKPRKGGKADKKKGGKADKKKGGKRRSTAAGASLTSEDTESTVDNQHSSLDEDTLGGGGSDSDEEGGDEATSKYVLKDRVKFNTVVFGLGHVAMAEDRHHGHHR